MGLNQKGNTDMNLVPWRKQENHSVLSLDRDVDRFFEDFFSGGTLLKNFWGQGEDTFLPPVDIRETDEKYLVEAELPGVDPKEVKIQLEGDVLTISGERKEEKTEGRHRSERRHGSFERRFSLPGGVDSAQVEAKYKNGILTVELGKREDSRPRTIEVKVKD